MVPALPSDCALAAEPTKIINENNNKRLNTITLSLLWLSVNK
jgi:hypothetical protein